MSAMLWGEELQKEFAKERKVQQKSLQTLSLSLWKVWIFSQFFSRESNFWAEEKLREYFTAFIKRKTLQCTASNVHLGRQSHRCQAMNEHFINCTFFPSNLCPEICIVVDQKWKDHHCAESYLQPRRQNRSITIWRLTRLQKSHFWVHFLGLRGQPVHLGPLPPSLWPSRHRIHTWWNGSRDINPESHRKIEQKSGETLCNVTTEKLSSEWSQRS